MAVNIQGVPYQPHPQGSLIEALRSGFGAAGAAGQAAGQLAEGRNKPQQLAESLLASRLANQINTGKAKYAEPMAFAELQTQQGEAGLIPLRKQLFQAQMKQAENKAKQLEQDQELDRQLFGFPSKRPEIKSGTEESKPNALENLGLDIDRIKQNPLLAGRLKKKFGIDVNAETPQQKRMLDAQKTMQIEEDKAKIKEIPIITKDIDTYDASIKRLEKAKEIIEKKPHLFGPGWLGLHPWRQKTFANDKDIGILKGIMGDVVSDFEKKLSSRGSQQALKSAENYKFDFSNQPHVALGNIENQINDLKGLKSQSQHAYSVLNRPKAPEGSTWMYSPSGKLVPVPNERIEEALTRNWKHG